MSKQILLIAGALIILILVAVWGYLFFFGTPESADDVFADLGLSGEVDETYVPPPAIEETPSPVVNMDRPKLRQLTTKPVAGFREVVLSTTTAPVLYYVEKGTGHVYTIDIESGEEVRVSGTTVAQAERAIISANGRHVAITSSGNTKNRPLFVGSFSTTTGNAEEILSETVLDFTLTNTEVLYTTASPSGLTGTAIALTGGAEKNIFTLPFSEVRMIWGNGSTDTHYVYPKATYALEGFLYEVAGGNLNRLPVSGFGLTANANSDMVLFSRGENQTTRSYIYSFRDKSTQALDAAVVPEKCLLAPTGTEFVCPFEAVTLPYQFPDTWYKGALSFKDSLWLLDGGTMSGELLVDTFAESGREIDIMNLTVSDRGGVLYFSNKNDNTLWMYEI